MDPACAIGWGATLSSTQKERGVLARPPTLQILKFFSSSFVFSSAMRKPGGGMFEWLSCSAVGLGCWAGLVAAECSSTWWRSWLWGLLATLVRKQWVHSGCSWCRGCRRGCCCCGCCCCDGCCWWQLLVVLLWRHRQGVAVGADQGAVWREGGVMVAGSASLAKQSGCWSGCSCDRPCYLGSVLV